MLRRLRAFAYGAATIVVFSRPRTLVRLLLSSSFSNFEGGAPMSSGSIDKAKGRIKEAAGALTDDDELKREGKVDKASGKIKEGVERAVDKVRDAVTGKKGGNC